MSFQSSNPPTTTAPVSCASSTGTDFVPGIPFSPILLANNTMVVVATSASGGGSNSEAAGYIYAFWADDLTFIAATKVHDQCSLHPTGCEYETHNTPAASYNAENRFYLSMNASNDEAWGLLAAFDVNVPGSGAPSITMPWSGPRYFGGPSGASPAVVKNASNKSDIYFDGGGKDAGDNGSGFAFAVSDNGTSYSDKWTGPEAPTRLPLSGAVDNFADGGRNCVWWYYLGSHTLTCLKMDTSGAPPNVVQGGTAGYSIDIRDLTDLPTAFLCSGIRLTRPTGGGTVLIVGINSTSEPQNSGRIMAIKLTGNGTSFYDKYWSSYDFPLPQPNEWVATQFPIVTSTSPAFQGIVTPSTRSREYIFH